ncbi:MAG: methyltransferase domain-containing protein [Planctomycetes bacterium]|nr:methyltransferase domain-containing protein [Planctomycetota bacterium]
MNENRLNLGCGTDIKKGWTNLDIVDLPGVDVVWGIEDLPLPFEDQQFEEVLCKDILEHVDYILVLQDIHRILKPGGRLRITVPHFTSRNNFVDPTHRKQFSVRTFDFFLKNSTHGRDYYFDFHFSSLGHTKITFENPRFPARLFFLFNAVIDPLVNLNSHTQNYYEISFLSRLFPGINIETELIK